MGMWVTDPRTGETVWDEEAQPGGFNAPGAGQRPPSSDPGVGAFSMPAAPAPAPAAPQPIGPLDFSFGMRNAATGQAPYGGANSAPAAVSPQAAPGTVAGDDAGRVNPHINFGSPTTIRSEDQNYLDAIQGIMGNIGTTPMPGPSEMPAPPTFTADPALAAAATQAEGRNARVQEMLGTMREDLLQYDPQARNRWQRFGEFLGQWAASGRIENAGAIMSELLTRDREMARELQRETYRLTLMGLDSEAAMQQAQNNLLSGQHQAAQQTQTTAYEHGVADTQRQDQFALGAFETEERRNAQRNELGLALAEGTRNAESAGRDRWEGVVSQLLQSPTMQGQASNALAESAGVNDPRAQSFLSDSLMQRQRAAGLLMQIQSADLSNDRSRNQLAQLIQQFNPSVRADQLRRLSPEQIFLLAVQGPNAEQAFRNNSNLARGSQYSGFLAEAQ